MAVVAAEIIQIREGEKGTINKSGRQHVYAGEPRSEILP